MHTLIHSTPRVPGSAPTPLPPGQNGEGDLLQQESRSSRPLRATARTELLLWGCIRDSGGVDLQTKLYERDRDSGKEIPHKESFPKVESPMNPRIVVYKSA